MALARRWCGMAMVAAGVAIGAALYTGGARRGGDPDPEPVSATPVSPAASEPDPDPGLVIHGFVQARTLDPGRWRIVGTPLRYEEGCAVPTSEIDSRGRFELLELDDVDYRVELVQEGEPRIVLATADHVRPGGEELVLELDPLALASLRELCATPSASEE